MSYTISNTSGSLSVNIVDGSINRTATDLTFIGRGAPNYGSYLNTNFLKLLENFANTTAPGNPITGQIWYDTLNNQLKVYNGTAFIIPGSQLTDTNNIRFTVKSTGTNNLAGLQLTGRTGATDSTWTIDSRGGYDNPNNKILHRPNICAISSASFLTNKLNACCFSSSVASGSAITQSCIWSSDALINPNPALFIAFLSNFHQFVLMLGLSAYAYALHLSRV